MIIETRRMRAGESSKKRARLSQGIGFARACPVVAALAIIFSGCSNLTGWRIPGTELGAGATTTIYLVLENVEAIPEQARPLGEIYVNNAFFGNTSRPTYYRYVGNELVVGKVQVQKERTHTISVRFPGYETFAVTRYFGTLPEYSVAFSLTEDGKDEQTSSDSPISSGEREANK
jgi:hypothetical protein